MRMTLAAIALLFALPVSGTAPTALMKCSALTDSVKRLECYDRLAQADQTEANKSSEKAIAPATVGLHWRTRIEASKIDDSTSVFVSTRATSPIPGRFSRASSTPTLFVRCLENTTSVFIEFDGLFMSDHGGNGTATFRVDKKPAFERSLHASTNHSSLGLWTGGGAIPLIKQLYGGNSLIVRASPHNESPRLIEFNIEGIERAVEPVRKSCGW